MEQAAEFLGPIIDMSLAGPAAGEAETPGEVLLIPEENVMELQAEEPSVTPEAIAIKEFEDGLPNWPLPETAFTERPIGPEDPGRETDGIEGEAPYAFSVEGNPADIYANPESDLQLGQAEDMLMLLAESVNEYRVPGGESLDEILEEITLRIEAISSTGDITPGEPGVYRISDTESAPEQEAAENLEELEKLFYLLIETVDAENSPQLVKLFVRLAAVQAEKGSIRSEGIGKPAPDGEGTHEAIRQLMLTLKSMNNIQDCLRHIGDSAIRLFLGFGAQPGSKRPLQVV
ncbi:MAG TPA: hypothetical protein VFJ84_03085 [Candidatus Saccharimonadales bacterium]|nr:hypothetical protein [Candidatus Saccharimonadales bacterium]